MLQQRQKKVERRAVILMVVLAMLTLFTIVGITFVYMSDSYALSARIARDAETNVVPDLDPEQAFAFALSQIIYDLNDDQVGVTSALRGHSLARNMYGWNPGQVNDKPYAGLGRLRYAFPNPAQPGVFSGSPAIFVGKTNYDLVNYQYFASDIDPTLKVNFLRDPENVVYTDPTISNQKLYARYGQGLGQILTKQKGSYVPGNVPYTYVDQNNMFLAFLNPATNQINPPYLVSSNNPLGISTIVSPPNAPVVAPLLTGQLGIGSYHRPWLLDLRSYPGNPYGLRDQFDPTWTTTAKYRTLRPLNGPGTLNPNFPPVAADGYDVKNYDGGPQGNDSIWIDFGAPVVVAPNGQKYKMLVAPLLLELDSRMNVNVAGNVLQSVNVSMQGHAGTQGWGPWEMNLSQVFQRPITNVTASQTINPATKLPLIQITSANHGLSTGDQVLVSGVRGTTNANSAFPVSFVSANQFDLVNSSFNANYAGGGFWLKIDANTGKPEWVSLFLGTPSSNPPRPLVAGAASSQRIVGRYGPTDLPQGNWNTTITGAASALLPGISDIVITTNATHGLTTGDPVLITGVIGNTNANGHFTITVLNATAFSLNGTSSNAPYQRGGSWIKLPTMKYARAWSRVDFNGVQEQNAGTAWSLPTQWDVPDRVPSPNPNSPFTSGTSPFARVSPGFPSYPAANFSDGYPNELSLSAVSTANPVLIPTTPAQNPNYLVHPSLFNAQKPAGGNRAFSPREMAALLRYGSTNSESVGSDLLRLAPFSLAQFSTRNLLTTTSWDLNYPAPIPNAYYDRTLPTSATPSASPYSYQLNTAVYPPTLQPPPQPQYNPDPFGTANVLTDLAGQAPSNSEFRTDWRSTFLTSLSKINLNRTLTPYPRLTPTGYAGLTPAEQANLANNSTNYDNQVTKAGADRQKLAQDIFNVLQQVTGAQTLGPTSVVGSSQYNAVRYLAQLAVNIVDFIDEDNVSTGLNWFGTEWVFGVELPRLVINECYFQYDNDPTDPTITGTPGTDKATSNYYANVWVELLNPLPPNGKNAGDPSNDPATMANLTSDSSALLSSAPQGLPTPQSIYQLVLATQGINNPLVMQNPANTIGSPLLTTSTTGTTTQGLNTVTVASTANLFVGMRLKTSVTDKDAKGNTVMVVPMNTTIVGISGTTLSLSSNALASSQAGTNYTFTFDTIWVPQISLGSATPLTNTIDPVGTDYARQQGTLPPSGSTPKGFYIVGPTTANTVPTAESPGFTMTPAQNSTPRPALQVDFSSPLMSFQLPNNSAMDTATPPLPAPTILLQRLANPYLLANPTTNPYVTVDFVDVASVLTANGINAYELDARTYNSAGPNLNLSARRGAAARFSLGRKQPYYASSNNFAKQTLTYVQPNGTPTGEPSHTFNQHNGQAAIGPARPGDSTLQVPFDWLVHLDRPLISKAELLHVASCKPHELTQFFVQQDTVSGTGNTNSNTTIDNIPSTSSLQVGMLVTAPTSPGLLPANTVINLINSPTQITLSNNATATAVGVPLLFRGNSYANSQNAYVDPTTNRIQNVWTNPATRLYRFLEYADVTPFGSGVPFAGRVPGKININMVFPEDSNFTTTRIGANNFVPNVGANVYSNLFRAMCVGGMTSAGDPAGNMFSVTPRGPNSLNMPCDVDAVYQALVQARQPGWTAGQATLSSVPAPSGTPSSTDTPFWGFGVGPSASGDALTAGPRGFMGQYPTSSLPGIYTVQTTGDTYSTSQNNQNPLLIKNIPSGSNLLQGMQVSGPGIPVGTVITQIQPSSVKNTPNTPTTIQISKAATATATGVSLTFSGVNAYRNNELMIKLMNNFTTRSNVFAIWLTVGFFEVEDDTKTPPVLGAEVGASEGRNIRHRMFAIVDRTNMQLFATQNSQGTPITGSPQGSLQNFVLNTNSGSTQSGVNWQVAVGSSLVFDPNDPNGNEETVVVSKVDTTNPPPMPPIYTATFYRSHAGSCPVISRGNPGPCNTRRYDPRIDPVVLYYAIIQ